MWTEQVLDSLSKDRTYHRDDLFELAQKMAVLLILHSDGGFMTFSRRESCLELAMMNME